jgi:hypothetical protein
MDEAAWLACDNPELMLRFLNDRASSRKLRLFAVACCRHAWDRFLNDELSRKAVEVAERYADGMATDEEAIAVADPLYYGAPGHLQAARFGRFRQIYRSYSVMNALQLGVLLGFMELLLFPLILAVICAVLRIAIGVIKRSVPRVAFGATHLLVLLPLDVAGRPSGYPFAVRVGELLLVVLFVALVVERLVLRNTVGILLGVAGLLAFGVHVFLFANAP